MYKKKISSDPSPHSMLMARTRVKTLAVKSDEPFFVVEAWNSDDVDWENLYIKSSIFVVDGEGLSLLRSEYDNVFIPDN